MKLTNIQCPNCGAAIRPEKMDSICECPFCKAAFYIDDEEKRPDTVNIHINNYGSANKTVENQKVNNPFVAFLTVIFVFVAFAFMMFSSNIDGIMKAVRPYNYLKAPKSEPFREFTAILYGKNADRVTEDEYAKLSFLFVDRIRNDSDDEWQFSYSWDIDAEGQPIDKKTITVKNNDSVQKRDFQAFTGLVKAGYGRDGSYVWDADSSYGALNYKNLTKLKYFIASDERIDQLENAFFDPTAILELSFLSTANIENIKVFSNIKTLSLFGIWNDEDAARSLTALSSLKNLENLSIAFNSKNVSLNFLSSMTNLKQLHISSKDSDANVEGLEVFYAMPKLEALSLDGIEELKTLDFVKNMPLLHSLSLEGCNIASIEPLRDNLAITDIYINRVYSLTDVSALPTLSSLKSLYIRSTGLDRGQLPKLNSLKMLKDLTIETIHAKSFKGMTKLESLTLGGGWQFESKDLAGLKGLKELYILEAWVDRDIFNVISSLPKLRKLDVVMNHIYEDVSVIFKSSSIEDLRITNSMFSEGMIYLSLKNIPTNKKIKKFILNNFKVVNIDDGNYSKSKYFGTVSNEILSNLQGIEELSIQGNQIKDLDFVNSMPNLNTLDISDNYVTDVAVLADCPKLKKLICHDNPIANISVLSENIEVIK